MFKMYGSVLFVTLFGIASFAADRQPKYKCISDDLLTKFSAWDLLHPSRIDGLGILVFDGHLPQKINLVCRDNPATNETTDLLMTCQGSHSNTVYRVQIRYDSYLGVPLAYVYRSIGGVGGMTKPKLLVEMGCLP